MKVRYIRDWINGSDQYPDDLWTEIKAFDPSGVNVALGCAVTGSVAENSEWPYSLITDGIVSIDSIAYPSEYGLQYVTVDLGSVQNVVFITVWHDLVEGRTYFDTKTEVSADGVEWYTVYDSAVDGLYPESADGKTMAVNFPHFDITHAVDQTSLSSFDATQSVDQTSLSSFDVTQSVDQTSLSSFDIRMWSMIGAGTVFILRHSVDMSDGAAKFNLIHKVEPDALGATIIERTNI